MTPMAETSKEAVGWEATKEEETLLKTKLSKKININIERKIYQKMKNIRLDNCVLKSAEVWSRERFRI